MTQEAVSGLRRELDLEGVDELVADLGELCPRPPGQVVTLTLRLAGLLPGRRAEVELSLYELEGGEERPLAARTLEVDAQPHGGQVSLPPVRFALPHRAAPYRRLVVRARSRYLGQCTAFALPRHT